MKPLILTCVLTLSVLSAMAQTPANPASSTDADVSTLDGIMKAVYDVISGDAGVKRDWDRFRTLFHKDARLIPTGKNQQTGVYGGNALSPEDYIKRVEPVFAAQGFHERELARHVDQYGNIAQVFSTYHAFRKKDDKEPFLRGINSFQLMYDGKRWWVLTIYWQAETPDNPIPAQYLK